MGILTSDKFKPVLFVGLGGNGGKIVDILARRLKAHPQWSAIADLMHFIAIDTNKNDLDARTGIDESNRFLVSNFNAPAYVERKFGHQEEAADERLTQWWPKGYAARGGETPGAGQIRVESRMKLWYNLENDRAKIRARVHVILDRMTAREVAWRDNEDRVIRVYLYGSVAGGTGSGGFLPFAYLVRRWIELAKSSWRPEINAVLSLPTTFADKVKAELQDDVSANGYAALKELEYLTRVLGYEGGTKDLEFHVDPNATDPASQRVRGRPFGITYLIDRPETLSISKFEHAVADASYLLLFSPLLGAQAGEYDNYEKHQRTLALGHFSVTYGTFGTALLHLPRRDLIRYAALRYRAKAMARWITFGGDDPAFRVPWNDPAFLALSEEERNRRIDKAFETFVRTRADEERRDERRGVFTEIDELRGKGGVFLPQRLHERFRDLFARLDTLVTFEPVDPISVNESRPSIKKPFENLRSDYTKSLRAIEAELASRVQELRSGRFLQDFFRSWSVSPLAQRLLLVRELEARFLTPRVPRDPRAPETDEPEERDEDFAFLAEPGQPVDFDDESTRRELARFEQELVKAASPGLFESWMDKEKKSWNGAKRKAVSWIDDLVEECRMHLKRYFWQRYEAAFRQVAEEVLVSFRRVSQVADEAARSAEAEAEQFRRDPASLPGSEVASYYLDAEVLRDDRRRERLWHLVYDHVLDRDAYFDKDRILALVTDAFLPERDAQGATRARDARRIVEIIGKGLEAEAAAVCTRVLDEVGMDLARGLELEQRFIHLLDQGADFAALRSRGQLEDAVARVPDAVVREGIADRFRRLDQECVLLGRVEERGGGVVPAQVRYAGLAESFRSDEPGSLGAILKRSSKDLQLVDGWTERDSLVIYKATLGIPVYWFRNVEDVLEPAYRRVMGNPARSYPLHIEDRWEREGLPNLNAVEIRMSQERERAEAEARAAASVRETRVRTFTLSAMAGHVTQDGETYRWSVSGAQGELGRTRREAFERFFGLPDALREIPDVSAGQRWTRSMAERSARRTIAEEIETHLTRLQQALAASYARDDHAEGRYLAEEIDVVKKLLAEARA